MEIPKAPVNKQATQFRNVGYKNSALEHNENWFRKLDFVNNMQQNYKTNEASFWGLK